MKFSINYLVVFINSFKAYKTTDNTIRIKITFSIYFILNNLFHVLIALTFVNVLYFLQEKFTSCWCFFIVSTILLWFLIDFFVSIYSFNTLFTGTSSSRLTSESIKALEIPTSMLFNLVFVNNTILLCFVLFLLAEKPYCRTFDTHKNTN